MKYDLVLKPRSLKDLRHIPKDDAEKILVALERLQEGLAGDVKKLTNFTPEYRLRIGNYRALFEIESDAIIVVYRIRHRREAYND